MRQLAMPVAVTLACVFVDVYWLGIPITMYGLAVGAVVGLVHLARGALAWDARPSRMRGTRVLVYGVGVALIILGIVGNVKLAASRAARVAAAVKQYRAATGDYPERLEQLVPAYLPEIPVCCVRATNVKFDYFRLRDKPHPLLFWVAMMPFGKGSYVFESDRLRPLWD